LSASPTRSRTVLRVLFLLGLAGWAAPAQGLELPDRPTSRINDYARALTPDARQRLEAQLRSYTTGQSYQMAVALFRSLDGENLEDVSIRLAEKWRIGSRKDDGVLITVFLAEHRIRIEVGYGLEDRVPDVIASRIIREVITPHFRTNDYEGGLRAGLAALDAAITGRTHPEQGSPLRAEPKRRAPGAVLIGVIAWALFAFVVIMINVARRRRHSPYGSGGWSAGSAGWIGTAAWLSSGMSSWSSSDSSDSGGSSFGGGAFSGGGGSFGGGGASGSW
jgi:uncharacterized protein